MPQLIANQTVTALDAGIAGNGTHHLFISDEIATNNNKAVDIDLAVSNFTPNRDAGGQSILSMVVERKDDAGNWHPYFSLHDPVRAISYGPTENGGVIPDQQMRVGPNIFQLEGDRAFDISNGLSTIAQEHKKQGVMPSRFRICVIVHESAFGNAGAFQEVTLSLDYELRAE